MQHQAFAQLPFERVQRVQRGHRFLKDEADVIAAHAGAAWPRRRRPVRAPVIADRAGARPPRPSRPTVDSAVTDLPEPDSPTSATVSPLLTCKADAADRRHHLAVLTKADAQIADFQNRRHRKVFLGSKASRMPSKMKISSDSMMAKVKKAVKPSHGA